MKKLIWTFTWICIILALFSGCSVKTNYIFLHPTSKITDIEIIKVGTYTDTNNVEQTTLYVADDIDAFLAGFNDISCYIHFTDPVGVEENTIAIKFIYDNEEYELVTAHGRATYTKEHNYEDYQGYRTLNTDEYDEFISQYILNAD